MITKKRKVAESKVDRNKFYSLKEASTLVKEVNTTKFDSSVDRDEPFETPIGVGYVIKGWDLGVIGMKVGGKRRLIIPHELGYGKYGVEPDIPGFATLIFDVELLKIK